jgi:hypothetical protein
MLEMVISLLLSVGVQFGLLWHVYQAVLERGKLTDSIELHQILIEVGFFDR